MAWPTWQEAMREALYGPDGFFRTQRPADHFRTSVHASDQFAQAIAQLAASCPARTVVDVGAGGGELLTALARHDPGLDLVGVDISGRPPNLPAQVEWTDAVPAGLTDALVIANEWLDNVPVDIVEVDDDRTPRLVHVDPRTGRERLGQPLDRSPVRSLCGAAAWLERWWPVRDAGPGERAEVGHTRDLAWAGVVAKVRRGVVVAADYCHVRSQRPPAGSLSGYRDGRAVPPVPDGSCDLTAHVALDACAAAGERAGATSSVLTSQRHALRALGVDPTLPSRELARRDPPAYLHALNRANEAAELLDPAGLGGFGWLVQAVEVPLPEVITALPRS